MKKKLFVSAMSLIMAIVLMTSTSFAWFTVSTAPEVTSIEVTMEATKNLEIAKATNNSTEPAEVGVGDATTGETTWGAKVTSFTGATLNFPAKMVDSTLKTISYATDGRVDALGTTISLTSPTLANGVGSVTQDITNGPTDAKVAAVYGVWLRSNVEQTVTAAVDSTGLTVTPTAAWATGKTNADAIQVVVSDGTTIGNTISLAANTAKLVYIIVYMDGDAVIAKSVPANLTISGIKVTFTGSAMGA